MMKLFKLFWILLFVIGSTVPLFHMNTAEISEQENRTLANFPEIKKKGNLNENFGKDFETWLGDRFFFRNSLIKLRSQALYKINGRIENDKAFIGDDGWMFSKSTTIYVSPIDKQRERVKRDAEILKHFADKFKGKDIQIYLVLVPKREIIYQKYWEKYYKPKPMLNYEKEIKQLISDYPNIKLIPIENELQKLAEKEIVFFKDDNHLTNISRNLIIERVFQHIKNNHLQDFPNVVLDRKEEISTEKHVASISALLMMAGKTEATLPKVSLKFGNLNSQILEKRSFVVEKDLYKGVMIYPYIKSVNSEAPIKKHGIFLGPCYTEDAYDILNPLFETAIKIRPSVQNMGDEAVSVMQNRLNELPTLESDAVVFVMILEDWSFSNLKKMMNGL